MFVGVNIKNQSNSLQDSHNTMFYYYTLYNVKVITIFTTLKIRPVWLQQNLNEKKLKI